MEIKPILKAMLLCDMTLVEEGTRKRSLIGIFDSIKGREFPLTHASLSVYVQFKDIQGVFDFTLELFDLEEGKSINKAVIKDFNVQNRFGDCELVFNLLSVRFEHAGDYEFRIYLNDMIFGQKSFQVTR